jgi:hypothetical protein
MDAVEARAILVIMEVIGKMMVGLADTGALQRSFVKQAMLTAAEHLEPVSDDKYLALIAEQWRGAARLFDEPRSIN